MPEWQRWKGIMKAVPFEEKRLLKWQPPFIVQPKLDGDRGRNLLGDRSFLVTSEENPVFSVPHINEELDRTGLCQLPLDGEYYSHQMFLEGGHELIHSIVSRTVNLHPRHKEMEFWVFDLKYPTKDQLTRQCEVSKLPEHLKHIKKVPFWICDTLDDIKRVYDTVVNQGFEGIIVRNLYGLYQDKRSTMLMKFKPKKKDDYVICGWKEEVSADGIPKGRIGSLLMSSQTGDEFSVSAGLDVEEKERLWEIRGLLKGMTATVHYQHLTNRGVPKGTFNLEVHYV